MDRKSFLCCQSFLYPISFSSIPGDLLTPNQSNSKTARYSHDVLIDGMNLSIEPCENNSDDKNSNNNSGANKCDETKTSVKGQNFGPAYFLTKNTNKYGENDFQSEAEKRDISSKNYVDKKVDPLDTDPTFCKVQFTLYTAKLPLKGYLTPIRRENRRDLFEIDDHVVANNEVILIANIDGNYFQFDLNRICSISIGQSEANRSLLRNDNIEEKYSTISNFLLLELPSCYFRLFPPKPSAKDHDLIGNVNSSQEKDHDSAILEAVRNRLESLLSDDYLLPFPLSYSGLTDLSGRISELDDTGEDNNYGPLDCSRRCLQSYAQSWKDLILLDDILENPYSETSSSPISEKQFKETVNHLMAKIPKQVSSCFIEKGKRRKALELCENKISRKIKEFDPIVDSFWNEASHHKSNKRRRNNENSEKSQSIIQHDCVQRFANILEDHKKYIISKHELYLLPLRG